VLLVLVAGCSDSDTAPVPPPATTAAQAAGPGPFPIVTRQIQTGNGERDELFTPASYAALGFLSPIVTWGSGTGAAPDDYRTLLSHLASWGFTVIASTRPDTGSGREILAAARYLVTADRTVGDPYHHRLDIGAIAAMGHSQGATGAVRAAEIGGRLVSTVVTFSLPWNGQGPVGTVWDRPRSLGWSAPNPDCPTAAECWPDPVDLHVPTLLIGTRGPLDAVIAPPGVERCYFEEVHAPAALGIVRDSDGERADHLTILDTDRGGNPGGLLGYVTAWLLDQLRHDRSAATVFSGKHPALLHDPEWAGSAVKTGPSEHSGCG
jgi:hypothetical protein